MLDKIVPGYYHRREEHGPILQTTCCNNTATEHAMCERLVLDDVVHWAVNYKVLAANYCKKRNSASLWIKLDRT